MMHMMELRARVARRAIDVRGSTLVGAQVGERTACTLCWIG